MLRTAQKFIQALAKLERERNLDELVELFRPDCVLESALSNETQHGREGARRFFQQYRASFDEVCSTYRAIIEGEGQVALEWTTVGRLRGGEPFRYRGVTVLDFLGPQISRMRAYFDPSELEAAAPHAQPSGEPTLLSQPELH